MVLLWFFMGFFDYKVQVHIFCMFFKIISTFKNTSFIKKRSLFWVGWGGFKGTLHIWGEIGSFYNSPRVKWLSLTVFEYIQPISGSGGSTFSLALFIESD